MADIKFRSKKVLGTQVIVDIMCRADASDKQIRIVERIVLDALRAVAQDLKRTQPDFSLRISQ